MSVRVFLDEINTWFSGLSKGIHPYRCEWASRATIEQKGKERWLPSLSSWAGASIFSFPQTADLLILGPAAFLPLRALAFLILHLTDSTLTAFAACISTWANSCHKSPLTYLYISYWSISLENPNMWVCPSQYQALFSVPIHQKYTKVEKSHLSIKHLPSRSEESSHPLPSPSKKMEWCYKEKYGSCWQSTTLKVPILSLWN